MAKALSFPMLSRLRAASEDGTFSSAFGITEPTMCALERRGLVQYTVDAARTLGGAWKITEAGRQALNK
jgi:hypothetical protein